MWVCVCVGLVNCGFVCVWIFNECVCVCVDFTNCGCVYV